VLQMLDRKISHFEAGTLATVLYAVAEPPYDSFVVSSAGHWPPLVADGRSPASAVDLRTDTMLGLLPDKTRTDTVVPVPEGGSLCLFTDGLIEQRFGADQVVDPDVGLATVAASLATSQTAEASCVAVLADLMPEHGTVDDVALLVIRRETS
jgi:sigma-B regulation protein RsbU (phosphoserine phosphatase)